MVIFDLWRDILNASARLLTYLWHIILYSLYISILIYVFSLLDTRLEFIVVSSCGLIYTVIASHGLEARNATATNLHFTIVAIGKMRLLLNETTPEEQQYGIEILNKSARTRSNGRWISITYLAIIEIICLYQLLKHLGSPYVDVIAPYIPPNLKPYF